MPLPLPSTAGKSEKGIAQGKKVCYDYSADGALEKRLTHMPFTHAFTGSNPVRVTIRRLRPETVFFFVYERRIIRKGGSVISRQEK